MKKTLLLSAFLAVSGAMNAQWVEQNTNFFNFQEGVEDIVVLDANTVWGLGYDGAEDRPNNHQEFTRTANGGTTWIAGSVALGNTELKMTNISAVSATTAWVGAVTDDGGGGVWKTTDGGTVWSQQNSTAYTTPEDSFFNVVHFFDANTGITQGDPINGAFELYRTTNGGNTWTAIASPAPAAAEYGYNGGNVGAGNSFWFVTNQGKLYRTTDTGLTWTKLTTPITDFGSAAAGGRLYFSDNNNGIIIGTVGTTSTLYKTSNGGNTWTTAGAYTAPYSSMSYIPGTTILVGTGRSGAGTAASPYIFYSGHSSDNGSTWTIIESTTQGQANVQQKTAIQFANPTTGWAGGFVDGDLAGGIFKYTGPSLSVNSITNKVKVAVYPNPANDVLNIKGESISKVVAFDILGKQVANQDFSAQNEVSVNVSSLRTGMYILQITNDLGATETIKFAKK